VELFIRGNEDQWRIQRLCAYKIVEGFRGSKDMPDIKKFISLPYDFEMKEEPIDTEALVEYYNSVAANWN
jgi:hypothetical protein